MRISSVETFTVRLPTRRPHRFVGAMGPQTIGNYVIVKVEVSNGLVGLGEATIMPTWGGDHSVYFGETVETTTHIVKDYLASVIIGADPFGVEALLEKMDEVIVGYPYAKAAVDMALYDIMGKAMAVPSYNLLGGLYRRRIPLAHSIGIMDIDSVVAEAKEAVGEGVRTIKLKVGVDGKRDVEAVRGVREVVGEGVGIMVDANQGYPSPKAAISVIRKMEESQMKFVLKTAALVFAVLAFAARAEAAGSATLKGKATLSGPAPAPSKILMAADPACAQQHPQDVLSQEVAAKGGQLAHVLVYIKEAPPSGGTSLDRSFKEGAQGNYPAPEKPVVLNQAGCVYEPRVFGIQAGQKLEIINGDPTLHNVNCQAKLNKRFNIAQPVKGMKSIKTFDQPEVGISFKCNVHPWMAAYAGVFNHPFYAVTDASGAFSIPGLPAGTYTIEAWHEKLGTKSRQVTVADGETKSVGFSF